MIGGWIDAVQLASREGTHLVGLTIHFKSGKLACSVIFTESFRNHLCIPCTGNRCTESSAGELCGDAVVIAVEEGARICQFDHGLACNRPLGRVIKVAGNGIDGAVGIIGDLVTCTCAKEECRIVPRVVKVKNELRTGCRAILQNAGKRFGSVHLGLVIIQEIPVIIRIRICIYPAIKGRRLHGTCRIVRPDVLQIGAANLRERARSLKHQELVVCKCIDVRPGADIRRDRACSIRLGDDIIGDRIVFVSILRLKRLDHFLRHRLLL